MTRRMEMQKQDHQDSQVEEEAGFLKYTTILKHLRHFIYETQSLL